MNIPPKTKRLIVQGRILEILSRYGKGGTTVRTIVAHLNDMKFDGLARAWYRNGFTSREVCSLLIYLRSRDIVVLHSNGNGCPGVWKLNREVIANGRHS